MKTIKTLLFILISIFMGYTLQIRAMEYGSYDQSSQESEDRRNMPAEYVDYLEYVTQETRSKVNTGLPYTLPTMQFAKRSAEDRFHNRRQNGFIEILEVFPQPEEPAYTLPEPRNTKLSWADMKKATDCFHNVCTISPAFAKEAQRRGGHFTLEKTASGYKKAGHGGYCETR